MEELYRKKMKKNSDAEINPEIITMRKDNSCTIQIVLY